MSVLQLNNKKGQNILPVTSQNTQMAKEYMKKMLNIITEQENNNAIETTMRHHRIPISLAKMKNTSPAK